MLKLHVPVLRISPCVPSQGEDRCFPGSRIPSGRFFRLMRDEGRKLALLGVGSISKRMIILG